MKRQPWSINRDMFLSEQEVTRLGEHVRGVVEKATGRDAVSAWLDRFVIEALLYSGLRNSEFCRLKVDDFVVDTGQPAVWVRGRGVEERVVYIPEFLAALVTRWLREVRPRLLPDSIEVDDVAQPLVFNERRHPYERTGLYRRVVRILTDAGLGERASVQLLRHTYGYLAYRRTGGNLLFVQRQLGHAHPMVTSIYAQFAEESYSELANRVYGRDEGPEVAAPMRYRAEIEDDAPNDRDPARLL
jgi:integrase/recombinase XerD